MALLDIFVGDRAALRAAERELVKQEDRVFRKIEGEEIHLATHVIADISRFETINARQRLNTLEQNRRADRNMTVMIGGFLIVYAKLFGGVDLLLKVLQTLGN